VPDAENPETNRQMIEKELGDLFYVINLMQASHDIREVPISRALLSKEERIKPYLHHQGSGYKISCGSAKDTPRSNDD